MNNQTLHIISFDNPFPPNYGGIIDLFYNVKALHSLGIKIYLHCYVEEITSECTELQKITEKVYFYKKEKKISHYLKSIPFSVCSRFSQEMIQNLDKDNFPILFEGLQSTMILNKLKKQPRKLFLRLQNNEERYYLGIFKSEKNAFKKLGYWLESIKYRNYQKTIFYQFERVFTLSESETKEIESIAKNSTYVRVFHGNSNPKNLSEKGDFAMYHGDLRISDNKKAVDFLISVFKDLPEFKFVIASKSGRKEVECQIKNASNISFVQADDHLRLNELFEQTHLHVLYSFQQSGTKLKVINSLFNGRFCLINSNMVDDKQIQKLCSLAETKEEFKSSICDLMQKPFILDENRTHVLDGILNDVENAKIIANSIFKD